MNRDGSLLATTSITGTLIRLFNPTTGEKLHELRRGSETCVIQNLFFEKETCRYLICSSNKEKIHIFKCSEILSKQNPNFAVDTGNTRSYFSAFSSLVSFAGSEWSFAQIVIPTKFSWVKTICVENRIFACCESNLFVGEVSLQGGLISVEHVHSLIC